MSHKVIVIGGGFAGLSAATALVKQGHQVTLLEGRQVLGGRAYSFIDPKTGDSVDNGQHLFMGCYHETQNFLKRIGTLEALNFQTNLSVDFMSARGRKARLRCWPLPSPWHLLSGLVRLSSLSWGDRWRLRHMHRALREAAENPAALDQITVDDWLKRWKQSARARRNLWDLITIAALNESPSIASASGFATVLSQAFFDGRRNAQLGFAVVGLSDLYVKAACTFIESHGGEVRFRSPVEKLLMNGNRVTGVQLRQGARLSADWVISAVPPPALLKLLPETLVEREPVFQKIKQLRFSPIISIHMWFDRSITQRAFVGLLGTHIQWLFNKSAIFLSPQSLEGYVSVVISGAHAFVDWKENRIVAMALEELRRVFPKVRHAALMRSLVIKEHQATLSPIVGSEVLRPSYQSPLERFLLAGDWTQTGLPATIESACVSGHACAEIIQSDEEEGQSKASTEQPVVIPDVKTGIARSAKQPAASR